MVLVQFFDDTCEESYIHSKLMIFVIFKVDVKVLYFLTFKKKVRRSIFRTNGTHFFLNAQF